MNNRSNIFTALLGMVLGVLLTSLAVRIVSNQKKFALVLVMAAMALLNM